MKNYTVKYFPPSSDNEYVANSIRAIEAASRNKVRRVPRLRGLIKSPFKNMKRTDFAVINWLENYLVSSNNRVSIIGVFVYFFYLVYFNIFAKKTIYVRHNIHPHNINGNHEKIIQYITNIGQSLCNIKVAHSGHLQDKGYVYIPHPLYQRKIQISNTANEKYFVMFGRIEKYKRFEDVITSWNSDNTLIIAGSTKDTEYLSKLQDLARDKNIDIKPEYLVEEDAQKLVAESQGIILAHAEKDMIVSGSFFYAITLGTPVFAIESPFFKWLQKEHGYKGLYTFPDTKKMNDAIGTITPPTDEKILENAELLFGHSAVKKNWLNLLKALS